MSFIVIEGDNGTGKDTQALKLSKHIGYDIITNYDDMIIFNKSAKKLYGEERVKKFLEYCRLCSEYASKCNGSIVVRYWVSTLAAAYADNIFSFDKTLELCEEFCSHLKKPDIIICLWCDYDNRIKRINDRKSEDFDDITKNRSIKYAWFLDQMKERYNINWVNIDTTGKSIDEVFNEILDYVKSLESSFDRIEEKKRK